MGWRSVTYHNLVTVTLNLTSDLVSRNCCISPIFFEIGIPNLVCKCILGYLSVTNHFWVTVTLTSDLVFKNYCVQSISPILFDVGIPNLGWWFLLGWRSGAYHFESFWPWHWLLASFLVFSCYITAIFPQMCLILDQFLWGHSSRVCDISCFFVDSGSVYIVLENSKWCHSGITEHFDISKMASKMEANYRLRYCVIWKTCPKPVFFLKL